MCPFSTLERKALPFHGILLIILLAVASPIYINCWSQQPQLLSHHSPSATAGRTAAGVSTAFGFSSFFSTRRTTFSSTPLAVPINTRRLPLLHSGDPGGEAAPPSAAAEETAEAAVVDEQPAVPYDYEVPEDAVIHIKPNAMKRLRELRQQQKLSETESLVLRMGVRSGGCSGMSYVMDFSTSDDIQDDDAVDEYDQDMVTCVVDSKSMLYLYGLELDYSDKLIGGGFQFFNPNAEESCGCGSSFGV